MRSSNWYETGSIAVVVIIVILALSAIVAAFYLMYRNDDDKVAVTERVANPVLQLMNQNEVAAMSQRKPSADVSIWAVEQENPQLIGIEFSHAGELFDVSESNAKGEVMMGDNESGFVVFATFERLPDPSTFGEGYFYEGWLIRREPFHMISTGQLDSNDGAVAVNIYGSAQDWTDHDYYVLTVEPNDGNPAPATHILGGILLEK